MKLILIILALVCALVLTVLGFGWASTDEPHLFGWVGLTLVFFIAAHLPLGRYFR